MAKAVHALAGLPGGRIRGVSRLYATEPVGFTDQPEFRNAVAGIDLTTDAALAAGALALLAELKALERAFGRVARERWGPRELDLDLLVFGRARLSLDRPPAGLSLDPGKADRLLVVPHPEAAVRLFVLAPLADVAAGLVPPGWPETVGTAARRRTAIEGPDSVRPVATWDPDRETWHSLAED
jgi:2-amino-4-hydroxy-6-hydroxymethyldihydropteridine diphosphokinase